MRTFFRSRLLVCVLCWLTALVVCLLPLWFTRTCRIQAWQESADFKPELNPQEVVLHGYRHGNVPLIGAHFGSAALLGLVANVFLDPGSRIDTERPMHLWARRYGIFMVLNLLACLMMPWVFFLCKDDLTSPLFEVLLAARHVSYTGFQVIAAWIGSMRLRLMGQDADSRRVLWCTRFCIAGNVALRVFVDGSLALGVRDSRPSTILFGLTSFSLGLGYLGVTCSMWHGFHATSVAALSATESNASCDAVSRVRQLNCLLLASGWSTVTFLVMYSVVLSSRQEWSLWAFEISIVVDLATNFLLLAMCAGILGPDPHVDADLRTVASLALKARELQILEKMADVARVRSGPALTLAALFEGINPEDLIKVAMRRFRAVPWEVLSAHPEIIRSGCALDGTIQSQGLYNLSQPCTLGQCDAFWSHSWHDNGDQKWEAISSWANNFKLTKGRSPKIWLDVLCIDQTSIKEDLQCLPIFLAGCKDLVITSGSSYTERLWCCVEMFVYVSMQKHYGSQECVAERAALAACCIWPRFRQESSLCTVMHADPTVFTLGADWREKQRVRNSWREFDAQSCRCFSPEDKERIMSVIQRHEGGIEGFNENVRTLACALFGTSSGSSTFNDQP